MVVASLIGNVRAALKAEAAGADVVIRKDTREVDIPGHSDIGTSTIGS